MRQVPSLDDAPTDRPGRSIKFFVRVAAIAAFAVPAIPLQWVFVRLALPFRSSFPVLFHRHICAVLGIRLIVRGEPSGQRPLMIVANHVSWLDIIVLSAVLPVCSSPYPT